MIATSYVVLLVSNYPKKLGLIKRKITPDAQRSAIPTTTFMIIFFPPLGLPVAIIIPPTMIKTKDIIKINVTNILVKLHIKTGKAVAQVTLVSPGPGAEVPSSIQLPIKGIEVLSDIPQQTPGAEHGWHTSLTFFVPVGQTQISSEFIIHQLGLIQTPQGVQACDGGGVCWEAIQALYVSITDWEAVVGFGASQQGENCPNE